MTSDERFTVAFYGFKLAPSSAEAFYDGVVQGFAHIGYAPDRLSVSGDGYSGKKGDFKRVSNRIRTVGFATVESIGINSTKPGAITSSEYFCSATLSRHNGAGYAVVSIPSSCMADPRWVPLVRELARSLKPSYGIGYLRELRYGPVWFALGVGYGIEPGLEGAAYEEGRNRARWMDMAMPQQLYRNGVLRDIYLWNFLTEPQLNAKVGAASLQEWINTHRSRGVLSRFVDDMWLWEVNESDIPTIREALKSLIFNWRNYV